MKGGAAMKKLLELLIGWLFILFVIAFAYFVIKYVK